MWKSLTRYTSVSRDVVYKFSKMFIAQIGTYYTVIPDL